MSLFNSSAIAPTAPLYPITVTTIDGHATTLEAYRGKMMLIVNVASECGFTPQYTSMQKLAEQYKDKLVVLGFPSNEFGAQEPGTEEQIVQFCERNYGVTFPMFSKLQVRGEGKHPLYDWLSNPALNGWNDQKPTWNFCKYLIDQEGKLIAFFEAAVDPMAEGILSKLG